MNKLPYIHLRTQSSYSLAEGALKIKKIVQLAKNNNMPAIALTDNNNLFGALEFSVECVNQGIQPIIGTSLNLLDIKKDNIPSQINLLVKNEQGYKNLLYLSSINHINQKDNIGVSIADLKKYSQGLICYIGGEFNPLLYLSRQNIPNKVDDFINLFVEIFLDNFYFELQRIDISYLDEFESNFIELSRKYNIPLISSNNVKFEKSNDFNAHDALLCIAQKTTINDENRIFSNPNIFFKSSDDMYEMQY